MKERPARSVSTERDFPVIVVYAEQSTGIIHQAMHVTAMLLLLLNTNK